MSRDALQWAKLENRILLAIALLEFIYIVIKHF
jgi:hypothetical protein